MSTSTPAANRTSYKKVIKVSDLPKLNDVKNSTRAMMINRILDLLMPDAGRTVWKIDNAQLIKRLTATPDLAYLERVLDLAVLARTTTPKTTTRNLRFVITEASGGQRYNLNAAHANRRFLPNYDYDMGQLAFFISGLRLGYGSSDTITTLEAHMMANRNYGWVTSSGIGLVGAYGYGTTQLSQIVEKYPERVKLILDYRDMVGTIDISEADFLTFAETHTGFTPEQEEAIWQSRSDRAYNHMSIFYSAVPSRGISRRKWELVQDREEVMKLR